MKEIRLSADSTEASVRQIQKHIGGTITERFGEFTLDIDNDIAKGSIGFRTFDCGLSLMEHAIIYFDDILYINDTSRFNPIHFIYCSNGSIYHRFSNEKEFNVTTNFHSAIITSMVGLDLHTFFPKGVHLEINTISIQRKEFLKKRLINVEQLNEKLHPVFEDVKDHKEFAYFSSINLKMADHAKALRDIKTEGMTHILQKEGEVYLLLSMHIAGHDQYQKNGVMPNSLLKDELKIIRDLAQKIIDEPSVNYSLNQLSKDSGLSQAKLQEGFKLLYAHTVTEYIRHIRLEAASDLMSNPNLNISQIVYAIGFTSRSYFSKIFKEKYSITPYDYKKQIGTTDNKLE